MASSVPEGRSTPYQDPFLAANEARLAAAVDGRLEFDEATWDDEARGAVGLDVEVYRNFFLVCLKRFADGKRVAFERSERSKIDRDRLLCNLKNNVIVTFNGLVYDLPILFLALDDRSSLGQVKEASDAIIRGSMRAWEVEKELRVAVPRLNHVDLMEPNPSVRHGLKMLHARLHGRYLVDLPYEPDTWLTPRQMNVVTLYCHNDLDATEALYRSLREPLELRVALGKRYGLDLRSKSDAQIGEAIVKKRIEVATGRRIARSSDSPQSSRFRYDPPSFISFKSEKLRSLLNELKATTFSVNSYGKVSTPPVLENLVIPIGASRYSMGIGGLHSTEAHRTLRSDTERVLIDVDVASQYPTIIKNLGLYPPALGPTFLVMYAEMIAERLRAKDTGDEVTNQGGKIALNGVYGKLGSPHSILYAPNIEIATTLTGQLAILMLIELAETAGVPVVSANTDGVVFHCPRTFEPELDRLIADWETASGFKVDRTRYRALHSSSVNTYIAVKEDGKIKRKGWLADPWSEGDQREMLKKNPTMTVCSKAVVEHLTTGASIESVVFGETDVRRFVTVIRATAGASWRGHPLGKIVRYYWSYDGSPILTGGKNRVSNTEGARPLAELPDHVPADVDRLRYCEEAAKVLVDLGVT